MKLARATGANSETIVVPRNYRLRGFVESRGFNALFTAVIIVNASTLGLETSPALTATFGNVGGRSPTVPRPAAEPRSDASPSPTPASPTGRTPRPSSPP